MKIFINKYGFRIAVFLLLVVLLLWYIPRSANRYLDEDLAMIKKRANYALLYTLLFVYAVVLTIFFMRSKTNKQRLIAIRNLVIISIPVGFIFKPVFLAAIFCINQANTKTITDSIFIAENMAGSGTLLLKNITLNKVFQPAALHLPDSLPNIHHGDTVIISFKNGWLDYCFDPHLKNN